MKRIIKKRKTYMLRLTCQQCGRIFKSERFKKYCRPKCYQEVNAIKSQFRYQQLRKAYLKAMGKIA